MLEEAHPWDLLAIMWLVIKATLKSDWLNQQKLFTSRNTAYGSWSRRSGMVQNTNKERTICRFSVHGIHAVAAAVPVRAMCCFCSFLCCFVEFTISQMFLILFVILCIKLEKQNVKAALRFSHSSHQSSQQHTNSHSVGIVAWFTLSFGFLWHSINCQVGKSNRQKIM